MFSNTSVSNKVISINDYINRNYVSLEEIVDSLDGITAIPLSVEMILTMLSMRGLIVEHLQFGHLLTEDAKPYTIRKYIGDRLEALWKKDALISLLTEDITRLFKA